MRFLTMGHYKDAFNSLPQQERLKLARGDLEFWMKLKTKMGNKISFYGIPGWDLGVSVGDYDSLEEFSLAQQYPTAQAGLVDSQSYPLVETDAKGLKELIARMKP